MSNALATVENHNAIAPVVPQDKIQLLIDTVAPGLSKPQLALFVQVCNRVRLDPFARQIYAIVRQEWDAETRTKKPRMTIQTGIDGYRTIAERTGESDGGTLHEWCGPDGVWCDVWLGDEPPAAARATVHRKGRKPTTAIARWGAYAQTKQDGSATKMWAQRGPEQLAKCAEALALRTAFPDTMEGIYTSEEMAQADNEPRARTPLEAARSLPPNAKPQADPRVPVTLKDKALAGKLYSELSADHLQKLIDHFTGLFNDPTKSKFRESYMRELEHATAAFEALMERDLGAIEADEDARREADDSSPGHGPGMHEEPQ